MKWNLTSILFLKTVSINKFNFDRLFFYIYIYFRKFNVEFNEIITNIGHHARCVVVLKMMLNTSTFANNFDYIWMFSDSHL